jgi:hypothetical protein
MKMFEMWGGFCDWIYHIESIEILPYGDAGCEAVVDAGTDDDFRGV